MKKSILIFVAVVMMAGFSNRVMAQVSETNSANAEIIKALTLVKVNPLEFGKIATGLAGAGGTVVIATDGTPTPTTVGLVAGTPRTAGSYTIVGEASRLYTLTLPAAAVDILHSVTPANKMTVTAFTARCGAAAADGVSHTLDASGTETITVGATLTVSANQLAGTYTGTFPVTVVYN